MFYYMLGHITCISYYDKIWQPTIGSVKLLVVVLIAVRRKNPHFEERESVRAIRRRSSRFQRALALHSTFCDRKAFRIKNIFTSFGTSCNSIRNVYIRVLKNSSLEILGNPILFLLDNMAGSLPGRARDKKGSVVEIECKFREELCEAERQTHAYVYIECASE